MAHAPALYPTLIDTCLPTQHSRTLRNVLLAVAGSLLLAMTAKVQIPFWPVPLTMQTFAVLVIGMAYGWRLGAATVALYLFEGAMGLPVFASGAGLAYMAGPTGGYLAGFLAAATLMGYLAERGWDRTPLRTLAAMVMGTAVIFACGVTWLATLIGVEKAVMGGLVPFMTGEALKIALAAVTLPLVWKLVRR